MLKENCDLKRRNRKLIVLMTWFTSISTGNFTWSEALMYSMLIEHQLIFWCLDISRSGMRLIVYDFWLIQNLIEFSMTVSLLAASCSTKLFLKWWIRSCISERDCSYQFVDLYSIQWLSWWIFKLVLQISVRKTNWSRNFSPCVIRFNKRVAGNIATVYSQEVQDFVFSRPLNWPSPHMYSRGNSMIDNRKAQRLADCRINTGIELDRLVVGDAAITPRLHDIDECYLMNIVSMLDLRKVQVARWPGGDGKIPRKDASFQQSSSLDIEFWFKLSCRFRVISVRSIGCNWENMFCGRLFANALDYELPLSASLEQPAVEVGPKTCWLALAARLFPTLAISFCTWQNWTRWFRPTYRLASSKFRFSVVAGPSNTIIGLALNLNMGMRWRVEIANRSSPD